MCTESFLALDLIAFFSMFAKRRSSTGPSCFSGSEVRIRCSASGSGHAAARQKPSAGRFYFSRSGDSVIIDIQAAWWTLCCWSLHHQPVAVKHEVQGDFCWILHFIFVPVCSHLGLKQQREQLRSSGHQSCRCVRLKKPHLHHVPKNTQALSAHPPMWSVFHDLSWTQRPSVSSQAAADSTSSRSVSLRCPFGP